MKINQHGCRFNLLKKLKNDVIDFNNDIKTAPAWPDKDRLEIRTSIIHQGYFQKNKWNLSTLDKN